jgi:hypothetical protein
MCSTITVFMHGFGAERRFVQHKKIQDQALCFTKVFP